MVFWDSILTTHRVEDAYHFAGLIPGFADFKESEKLINCCYSYLVEVMLKY